MGTLPFPVLLLFAFTVGVTVATSQVPDHMTVKTPKGKPSFEFFWMTVSLRSLDIKVKACKTAELLLASRPQDTTSPSYQLSLTPDGVTLTDVLSGNQLKTSEHKGLLLCDYFTTIWVKWTDDNLRMGVVNSEGETEVIRYDGSIYSLTAVSFSGGGQSAATWRFYRETGWDVFMRSRGTNPGQQLWLTETQQPHFVFGVQATKQAKVVLSKAENDEDNIHLLVLGANNNTKTIIRKGYGKDIVYTTDTPGILSKDEMRYFWVSWDPTLVKVGRGLRVDVGTFVEWRPDQDHEVGALALFGNEAIDWHMRSVDENNIVVTCQGSAIQDQDTWINVDRVTAITFRVRLQRSTGIVTLYHRSANIREINIGLTCDGNSSIFVKYADGTSTNATSVDTTDLAHCDVFIKIGLSWKDGVVQLWKGQDTANPLLSWDSRDTTYRPQSAHFTVAPDANLVNYQLNKDHGGTVFLRTSLLPGVGFDQVWVMVEQTKSFVFKVKACYGVQLRLATYIFHSNINFYQIDLSKAGDEGRSSIFYEGNEERPILKKTPGILSCTEGRYFWVDWSGEYIRVGNGQVVGAHKLMELKDRRFDINAISVMSQVKAEWALHYVEEPHHSFRIPENAASPLDFMWVSTRKTSFEFSLKGSQDTELYLSSSPEGTAPKLIIIIIQAANRLCIIENSATTSKATAPCEGILNLDKFVSFWVSWNNGSISLGRNRLGDELLVTLKFDDPYPLSFIRMDCPGCEWRFGQEQGSVARLSVTSTTTTTPTVSMEYWRTLPHTTDGCIFRVKAAEAAELLLTSTPGLLYSDTFKITLGADNNTKSNIIRVKDDGENGEILAEVKTYALLNSGLMRTFWVSWSEGHIQVGRAGQIGHDRFLHWVDSEPVGISGISVMDSAKIVEWEFPDVEGEVYHMETTSADLSPWLTTPSRYMEFRVTPFSRLEIKLYAHDGYVYTVEFGNADGFIRLQKESQFNISSRSTESETYYPDLLTYGKQQSFYIDWNLNSISVGHFIHAKETLLLYVPVVRVPVEHIQFQSEGDIPTRWEVETRFVKSLGFQTIPSTDLHQYWRTAPAEKYLTFDLVTCGSVTLTLTETIELIDHPGNAYISLDLDMDELSDATSGLIPTNVCPQRKVWVSWMDGQLQWATSDAGGAVLYRGTSNTLDFSVNFVDFRNKEDFGGQWEFKGYQEIENRVQTFVESNSFTAASFALEAIKGFLFFSVASCEGAHLLLSSDLTNQSAQAFEIILGQQEEDGTQKSYIMDHQKGIELGSESGTILNCVEQQQLKVSWSYGYITVEVDGYSKWNPNWVLGSGREVVTSPLHMVGLASRVKGNASWALPRDEAELTHLFTSPALHGDKTTFSIAGRSRLVFTVQTCSTAILHFSPTVGDENYASYQLVLQNNTGWTYLQLANKTVQQFKIENLLNCSKPLPFWVSLEDDFFSFGQGAYAGLYSRIGHPLPAGLVLQRLTLSSGDDNGATWTVPRSRGNTYRFATRLSTPAASLPVINVRHSYITVSALTNAGFQLVLSPTGITNQHYSVTVAVGVFQDMVEIIPMEYMASPTSTHISEGLPKSSFSRFWISWTDGVLEIGPGDIYKSSYLAWKLPPDWPSFSHVTMMKSNTVIWEVDQHDPQACTYGFKPVSYKAAALSSDCPQVSFLMKHSLSHCQIAACRVGANVINVKENSCHLLRCETSDDLKLSNNRGSSDVYSIDGADTFIATNPGTSDIPWVDVFGVTSFNFKVKTCTEASIVLAYIPREAESLAYKVTLTNEYSIVWSHGGEPLTNVSTPGILSCVRHSEFVVDWSDPQVITVSAGSLITATILTAQLDTTPEISSVGVYSSVDSVWTLGDLVYGYDQPVLIQDKVITNITSSTMNADLALTISGHVFSFTVTTCSGAKVVLSNKPGDITSDGVSVEIGTDDNTQTTLKELKAFGASNTTTTPGILNCGEGRDFWLYWDEEEVRFGLGVYEEGNQKYLNRLAATVWTLHTFREVSFWSTDGIWRQWEVATNAAAADEVWVVTGNNDKETRLTVNTKNEFVFKVKACRDAEVIFKGVQTSFRIIIGADNNTVSSIRTLDDSVLFETQTDAILDCDEYRDFWVTWLGYNVEVGRSHDVGSESLMFTYVHFPVYAVVAAVTTPAGVRGSWRFGQRTGDTFELSTSPDGVYDHTWSLVSGHSLVFSLRSCEVGTLYLSADHESPGPTNSYLVTIGGGPNHAESFIQRIEDSSPAVRISTPGLITCGEYRQFWVSWYNNHIQVGQGNQVFENTFMDWHEQQNHLVVGSVAFTSMEQVSQAEWKIDSQVGDAFRLKAKLDGTPQWLTVAGRDHLMFRIKTAGNTLILLSQYSHLTAYLTYAIFVQTDKTVLKVGVDGEVVAIGEALLFNTNDYEWVWLSWAGGQIEMGSGSTLGSSSVLDWNSRGENYHPVEALGFLLSPGTPSTSQALFDFSTPPDKVYEITTDVGGSHSWLIWEKTSVHFRLTVEDAATTLSILLASSPEKANEKTYQFILVVGSDKTDVTLLRHRTADYNVTLKTGSTSKLMADRSYLDMWIQVVRPNIMQTQIELGTGLEIGQNAVIQVVDTTQPYTIKAIRVSTQKGGTAYWQFRKHEVVSTNIMSMAECSQPNSLSYWTEYQTESDIVFEVKSNGTINVQLWNRMWSHDVTINNTHAQISRTDDGIIDPVVVASTTFNHTLLDDTHFTTFWVTWHNSRVALGAGVTINEKTLIGYHEPGDYDVIKLYFCSHGGASDWKFPSYRRDAYMVSMSPTARYKTRLQLPRQSFTFTILGCEHAHMTLEGTSGDTSSSIDLILGSSGNSKTSVLSKWVQVEEITPDILACTEPRAFHLEWARHEMHVDNGLVVYQNVLTLRENDVTGKLILRQYMHDPIDVAYVTLHPGTKDLVWDFMGSQSPAVTYTSGDVISSYHFWHVINHVTFIIIDMKAGAFPVSLLFAATPGISDSNALQVTFTATQIKVTDIDDSAVLKTVDVDSMMNTDNFTSVWFSWAEGKFKVGRGITMEVDAVLTMDLAAGAEFNAVSVMTTSEAEAAWRFSLHNGNTYRLYTEKTAGAVGNEMSLIPKDNQLTVDVAACKKAVVEFSIASVGEATKQYEVVFGSHDNKGSSIMVKGEEVMFAAHHGVLQCHILRTFTLWWTEEQLSVSEGSSSGQPFLHTNITGTVRSVSLNSEQDSKPEWALNYRDVYMLALLTSHLDKVGVDWFSLYDVTSMAFRVQSTSNAVIAFSPGVLDPVTFTLTIGLDGYRTLLTDVSNNNTILAEANTPGILNPVKFCTFWVDWGGDQFTLGSGGTIGRNVMLRSSSGLPGVAAFTRTVVHTWGEPYPFLQWTFYQLRGNTIHERSPNDHDYNRLQMVPRDPASFLLPMSIRTCADAHVALFLTAESDNIEVIFGSYDNTQSEIRRGSTVKDYKETKEIMSVSRFTSLWVSSNTSSSSMVIQAGRGSPVTTSLLTYLETTTPIPPLDKVAIGTWYNCGGDWQIDPAEVETLLLITDGNDVTQSADVVLLDAEYIIFDVMTRENARVILRQAPGPEDSRGYEVRMSESGSGYSVWQDGIMGDSGFREGLINDQSYTRFWLSWANKALVLGVGGVVGEAEVIRHPVQGYLPLTTLSFSTTPGNKVHWCLLLNDTHTIPGPPPTKSTSTTPTPTTTSTTMSTRSSTTSSIQSTSAATTEPITTSTPTTTPSTTTAITTTTTSSTTTPSTTPTTESTTETTTETTTKSTITTTESTSQSTESTTHSTLPTESSTSEIAPTTTTSSSTTEGQKDPESGTDLTDGDIAGIVIGVLLAVALVLVLAMYTLAHFGKAPSYVERLLCIRARQFDELMVLSDLEDE